MEGQPNQAKRRISVLEPDLADEPPGGEGTFGAWAPGVLEEFLATVLIDRKSTAAGVLVGREAAGRPQIDGFITTVDRGRAGQVAMDRERWGWVHESRSTHYPDSAVIGWFCSRPGVEAVPTQVDVQTHLQFFPNGNLVMLCVDPSSLRVAAYTERDQRMFSIGSGNLHQMLGVPPTVDSEVRIPPELIGAGLVGLALGVVAWALTGAGSWPF